MKDVIKAYGGAEENAVFPAAEREGEAEASEEWISAENTPEADRGSELGRTMRVQGLARYAKGPAAEAVRERKGCCPAITASKPDRVIKNNNACGSDQRS